jgi:4-diphosphocytidyl-2C-methyl-D-erythritol kinase
MNLLSSAKINLNLKIAPVLSGNLHELVSDIIPIGIFDKIEILENNENIIKYDKEELNDTFTTVHKALQLIKKSNPTFDKKFIINISKNIPIQSGLGGGSSNAGTVISYLCKEYELNIPSFGEIAQSIGSDVPFFVQGCAARVEGIGQKITQLDSIPNMDLLIAVPKFGLSTKDVFNEFDKLEVVDSPKYQWSQIDIFNDLFYSASQIQPEILEIKKSLENKLNERFHMSGSGSSLFAIIDDPAKHGDLQVENLNLKSLYITKKIDCSFSQNDD